MFWLIDNYSVLDNEDQISLLGDTCYKWIVMTENAYDADDGFYTAPYLNSWVDVTCILYEFSFYSMCIRFINRIYDNVI